MANMKMKTKTSDTKRFKAVSTVFLGIMTILALLPIILIVIASLTDETTLLRNGYSFFPEKWSLDAYVYMFQQGNTIFRAYGISVLVTVIGTVLSVLITTTIAYPMSRRNFKYRNALAFFVFFISTYIRTHQS